MNPYKEVERLRDLGVARNAAGDGKGAIEAWTEMAKLQRRERPDGKRLLRGESWTNGFGHMALLDMWAKRRLLGLTDDEHVIVTNPGIVANGAYLGIWSQWFEFAREAPHDALLSEDFPMVIEVQGEYLELHEAAERIETMWRTQKAGPIISLPAGFATRGWDRLGQSGVEWFVGMHLRQIDDPNDTSIRNVVDELTYVPAIEAIRSAGGHVIRIGERRLDPPLPGVIDFGGYGDWTDLFVISQSRFFIGTNSGPSVVVGTFGRPLLIANFAPIGGSFPYEATLLRKRVVDRTGVDIPVGAPLCKNLWTTKQLDEYGLRLLDCTAGEIEDGVKHMMELTK